MVSNSVKDAQDLIELTCKKYAECKSYSDSGIASSQNDPAVRDIRFKTAYVRDDRFRFEFRQYHPHLGKSGPDNVTVVWSNGTRHTIAGSSIEQKDYSSLSGPVSGATGTSSASVIHIPSLLMPDLFSIRPLWLELEGAQIKREEMLGERKCLVLNGFRRITEYSVWIDSLDFCIRQIVQIMRKAESHAEERELVTTYNYSQINFDQTIESRELEPNFPQE